ncbi:MAG: hypothetical protein ACKVJQ_03830 [Alphaproteobacteria bacterium]|jgi:hypothetical protein
MAEYFSSGRLVVWNLLDFEITLDQIKLNCTSKAKRDDSCNEAVFVKGPKKLRSGFDGVFPARTVFRVPAGLQLNREQSIDIRTRIGEDRKKERVKLTLEENPRNPLTEVPSLLSKAGHYPFITVTGKDILVRRGNWQIKSPLRVPRGTRLVIAPGHGRLPLPTRLISCPRGL